MVTIHYGTARCALFNPGFSRKGSLPKGFHTIEETLLPHLHIVIFSLVNNLKVSVLPHTPNSNVRFFSRKNYHLIG